MKKCEFLWFSPVNSILKPLKRDSFFMEPKTDATTILALRLLGVIERLKPCLLKVCCRYLWRMPSSVKFGQKLT